MRSSRLSRVSVESSVLELAIRRAFPLATNHAASAARGVGDVPATAAELLLAKYGSLDSFYLEPPLLTGEQRVDHQLAVRGNLHGALGGRSTRYEQQEPGDIARVGDEAGRQCDRIRGTSGPESRTSRGTSGNGCGSRTRSRGYSICAGRSSSPSAGSIATGVDGPRSRVSSRVPSSLVPSPRLVTARPPRCAPNSTPALDGLAEIRGSARSRDS